MAGKKINLFAKKKSGTSNGKGKKSYDPKKRAKSTRSALKKSAVKQIMEHTKKGKSPKSNPGVYKKPKY
jgi:hypothetical protein